jgi:DNA polymerase II large subunit
MAQKAPKIWRMIKKLRDKGYKLSDWDFLEEFMRIHEKREKGKVSDSPTFIKDLVAGRPVFGHPSASGAFRLRYGRTRNTGFSSLAIHPATMYILGEFAAIGTQIKIELPTKGTALNSCDTIDGPIVKMKNGSVRKISNPETAKELYNDVEEIVYIGDLLIPYGDFANRNHILMPAGYVEQEWFQELKKKSKENDELIEIDNIYDVDLSHAQEISEKFNIALHPKHIFYWSQIDYRQFIGLLDWAARAKIVDKKLLLPYAQNDQERFNVGKRALELLGIPHEVITENVILDVETSQDLLANLDIEKNIEPKIDEIIKKIKEKNLEEKSVLEIINAISKFEIRDKAGTFIGARMGRPEKAKLRKLAGSPNVLFPVGDEGGRLRSVIEACNKGEVRGDFPLYFCDNCKQDSIFKKCHVCGGECKREYYCRECRTKISSDKCAIHNVDCQPYATRRINIKQYFDKAIEKIDLTPEEIPTLIKGVRGTSNKHHLTEHMAKGIIRAIFDLQVNKDGTIRFDATELPITHFKPKEISTSVAKLIELGYEKDIYGKKLENEEQILGLFPHDVVLPACPASADEKADDVFVRIANFIDTLLIKLYGMKPFYNIKTKEDLIGQLGACIAPHNCACVGARIIGFSKTQGLFASPYMHAAMRRDCDGDEAGFMLLLDTLLNFSMEFLPAHRGGTQDAPLVMNVRIRAGEVDDMIFDFDVQRELPLELYQAAAKKEHPSTIKIDQIKDRVGKKEFDDLLYEYETSDINQGVLCSSYKRLVTMQDKVRKQMEVGEKLRSVITPDVARLVIDRHFIRDIRGNLRKFSQQEFRCGKCNEKYRRPPLVGRCLKCGSKVIFTISEGSIIKYLEPAIELATKYDIPAYMKQSLELTKSFIESIFGKDKERQADLQQWF